MIIEKLKIKDGLRLEIVDRDDIMQSYKNNKLVDSCMSRYGRWKYTKLYKYITDLKLLRLMKGDDLALRALIWTVSDKERTFRYIDTVYHKKRINTPDSCGCCYARVNTVLCSSAYEQFKSLWPKYADVRNTAKQVFATLEQNKIKIWPYMDTFIWFHPKYNLLSNKLTEGFTEYRNEFTDAVSRDGYHGE